MYGVYVEGFENRDDYLLELELLKSIGIRYNSKINLPAFSEDRILEIELYFRRKSIEYSFVEGSDPEYEMPEKETRFIRDSSFDPSLVNAKLYNYQKEDIEWLIKRNRALVSSDPGLGKSLEAIAVMSHIANRNPNTGVVLFVKKSLSYHWIHEICNFSNIFKEDDLFILDNSNKTKAIDMMKKHRIAIVQNHLWADVIYSYKNKKKKGKATSYKNVRWNSMSFDLKKITGRDELILIIDESHEFKNPDSIRSKALKPFLPYFEYRYLLSATPAINEFSDYWNQMNILDRSIIPYSNNAFKCYISKVIGTQWKPFDVKVYDAEKVKETEKNFKFNILKRVKKDLPEMKTKQIIKPVYFGMSIQQRFIYDAINEAYLYKIEKEGRRGGGITLKNIQFKFPYSVLAIDNPLLLQDRITTDSESLLDFRIKESIEKWDDSQDEKLLYIEDYLTDAIGEGNEKVILFDYHPETLDMLAEKFKKYHPIVIHGKLKDSDIDRQNKVDLFNDRKSSCKLALLSSIIASAGHNFNKGARRVLYYSLPFDATLYRQSLDRTYRIVSVEDTLVEVLIYGNTIDEYRYNVLSDRVQFNDEFMYKEMSVEKIKLLLNRGKHE